MEDNDNNNSSNRLKDDGDQNRIVHQLLRLDISGERNVRKYLFWYDIRNFPDSLVIEILVRLPVKSIFMFKSVCKHWRTLITHPSFRRFYYSILNSNAALSSRLFRILYKDTYAPNFPEFLNRLRSGFHSSSDFSVLFLSSREERERNQYDQFRVLDMSNGLILCCSRNSTTRVYYIGHPLTGQWISLSRRQSLFHYTIAEGLMTRVDENHMITGYRVVRVDFLYSGSNYLHLEMFSSETRKWIRYQLPSVIPTGLKLDEIYGCPIHCYGALHWRVCYRWTHHGLIAFDPSKDQEPVRLIPLPNDRDLKSEDHNVGSYQLCGECQGTLRYFEVAEEDSTELYLFKMWAMKDYEKREWCREFKVRRSDLHSTDPELSNWLLKDGWFRPLSFHPLNPNVVYLTCMEPQRIVSYDALNRRLDLVSKPIDIKNQISWKYVIPFLVRRWPVLLSDAVQPCLTEGHSEVKRESRKQTVRKNVRLSYYNIHI